ncbi:uncharacterized protein BX663DRAFT_489715 [Cokeromyces recurvatus]|uniref:uncharacterized protein n=1 Tax=Cokeromyces recurvatus TaxID=90255 RepID=UPI002220C995|nr:uncharacterized protein BX663DRAFT_489715 [Cokeromyces recurvatus]KAI7898756.1 hypothetical protein BX663DRAFT_489715 [Cokeromyces recurvatus]
MVKTIIYYLLSLIGIKPIEDIYQHQKEEVCRHIEDSAFILEEKEEFNEKHTHSLISTNEIQDWLSRLSKMTLYQILTSAMDEYPEIANCIYQRHYEKRYFMSKGSSYQRRNSSINEKLSQLKLIQLQTRTISHRLDNLRPSDQFGRASEIAEALQHLIRSLHLHSDQSFFTLFSLIILAQESLMAPSEVRQHVFYHVKLGRILILEMSTILKNFIYLPFVGNDLTDYWTQLGYDPQKQDWLSCLEAICLKLARYDITWEYRKEYQEVITIAKRYYSQTNIKQI